MLIANLSAQDSLRSLAFKDNSPPARYPLFYQPDHSYQYFQNHKLIQRAISGDFIAQHELGIRYLLGENLPADTLEAAKWIEKAANQNLPSACYNYGIMLINGWGTEWNPFKAFKYFKIAAEAGMPQAQYITGIFYLENLVVKRNAALSKYWIEKASEHLDEAKNALAEIEGNNFEPSGDKESRLVYLNFNRDTVKAADFNKLIKDISLPGNDSLDILLNIENKSSLSFNSNQFNTLNVYAENGSPEALTILGYLYEKGLIIKKDLIKSASYYLRGIRLESPRSPLLLLELLQNSSLAKEALSKAQAENPLAQFVVYGLHNFGFINSITDKDAVDLLIKSSYKNDFALIELALLYYTGKYFDKDRSKALLIWNDLALKKNNQAESRIIADKIFTKNAEAADIIKAKELSEKGSLLLQSALAFHYEKSQPAEAVKLYRFAAQRGSSFAMEQLKRIYNDNRPKEILFELE